MNYRIAIAQWYISDGITTALCNQLIKFGHDPVPFFYDETIPQDLDIVLTFAPYNRFIQLPL